MNCIIVYDEPLARQGIELLVNKTKDLELIGSFSNAATASEFADTSALSLSNGI